MKDKILKLLNSSNDYISGEEISKVLGVTRSSIWKCIKQLKEEGYVIEGIPKKGYKLLSSPDVLSIFGINKYKNTKLLANTIKYYKSLQSTNATAKKLSGDLIDGSIIVSEIQEGGVGRFGRVWSSPHGGIWFSIILKPSIEPQHASKITIIAACALIKALEKNAIKASIKWPNDIYVDGKKLCGILTEMKCDMDTINYLVVGIGINANIDINSLTDDIKDTAISIKMIKNCDINRNKLLGDFLNEFERLYLKFINDYDLSETVAISKSHSMILNKTAYHVTIRGKEKVTCVGIDDNLELIIKDSNGATKNVLSGEITFK